MTTMFRFGLICLGLVQALDLSAQVHGQACSDATAPHTVDVLTGTSINSQYDGPVQVTLSATDNLSGVKSTYYGIDGGPFVLYDAPFYVSNAGQHTIQFYSVDNAGNTEGAESASFTIRTNGPAALQFVPMAPCRIADTRNGGGSFGRPALAANSTRAFPVRISGCGIPATALAYSVNATVVPFGPLGWLTLWPFGQSQPFVSTLNSDGRVKANAAIIPAGNDGAGSVNVYVTDATQFILDIDGYFVAAGSDPAALEFYSLAPCRIADTRNENGVFGGPFLAGGTTRSFPVGTTCMIPNNAIAYSLNLTAVPHGSLGFVTTWPQGGGQPNASVLNSPTGTVVANAAILPAGTPNGGVSVFASDDTDIIIDVNGYFAAPSAGGLSLYPVAPCRVLDTRYSSGALGGTQSVNVSGSNCNVDASAQAYVLNATVVPPGALTYVTFWPDGQALPNVSTLNSFDGAIDSNMAILVTSNGTIDAFASNPTQLILDISAYFAP